MSKMAKDISKLTKIGQVQLHVSHNPINSKYFGDLRRQVIDEQERLKGRRIRAYYAVTLERERRAINYRSKTN